MTGRQDASTPETDAAFTAAAEGVVFGRESAISLGDALWLTEHDADVSEVLSP